MFEYLFKTKKEEKKKKEKMNEEKKKASKEVATDKNEVRRI